MINQTVTWTSQSQGNVKTKTGTVTAIIEPGEDARKYLPAGLPKTRFKGDRISTNRRALVEVPRASGNGCDYYAPPVKWLEPVEKGAKEDAQIC